MDGENPDPMRLYGTYLEDKRFSASKAKPQSKAPRLNDDMTVGLQALSYKYINTAINAPTCPRSTYQLPPLAWPSASNTSQPRAMIIITANDVDLDGRALLHGTLSPTLISIDQ